MARRKKPIDDMSNDTETPSVPGEATRFKGNSKKPKHVILDYRGYVGRGTIDRGGIRNDRPVPHRLSPLMAYWPEGGVMDLQLQPGVNLVDAELWRFYTEVAKSAAGEPGHPQVMALVKARHIRVLDGLPEDQAAIEDMIGRSMDPDGLKWIMQQEQDGEGRGEIIDLAMDRLGKIRPVRLRPMAYQSNVPLIRDSNAPQPTLAMG